MTIDLSPTPPADPLDLGNRLGGKTPVRITLDRESSLALQKMMVETGQSASWCVRKAYMTSSNGERPLAPIGLPGEYRQNLTISAWKGLTAGRIRHALCAPTEERLPMDAASLRQYWITVYVPQHWLTLARQVKNTRGHSISDQIRAALVATPRLPYPEIPRRYARANVRLNERDERLWRTQAIAGGFKSIQMYILARLLQHPMPDPAARPFA